MATVSFRVGDEQAAELHEWAERLGITRSQVIRESLRSYLAWLASGEHEPGREFRALGDDESSIDQIADWGAAEDWSDWADTGRTPRHAARS